MTDDNETINGILLVCQKHYSCWVSGEIKLYMDGLVY